MAKSLRVVFMGTPEFAVQALSTINSSQHQIVAVVTAPDKPAGRGKQLSESAVKKYATENKIHLLQPDNLKSTDFIEALKKLNADLFVVVAFRMLPSIVWKIPPLGTINLHASLLPQYRGAAPINWAIINGEKETGVTTFFINEEIDTGAIISSSKISISDNMNAGDLHDLLMNSGARLLLNTIDSIADDKVVTTVQDGLLAQSKLKSAPKLTRENSKIVWTNSSKDLLNFIRGLSPYPGAYTTLKTDQNYPIKIFKASLSDKKLNPGEISSDGKSHLLVGTIDKAISLEILQVPNKRKMPIRDLLNGLSIDDWSEMY